MTEDREREVLSGGDDLLDRLGDCQLEVLSGIEAAVAIPARGLLKFGQPILVKGDVHPCLMTSLMRFIASS